MIILVAAGLMSVLELHNKLPQADRPAVDASYLADHVRQEVLDEHLGLQVMTRENMLVLLQSQGKTLAECEGECEVDTGRRLGADYVISGEVLRVGSQLKLSLKLHDTHNGTLLGAASASGRDVESLDAELPAAVRRLTSSLQQGQPAPQAQAAPPAADFVTMSVEPPPEGKWLLMDGEGGQVCTLPCTSKLSREQRYYAERDAALTADRTRVPLPATSAFAPGRSAEATYVSGRGSRTLGIVGLVAGLGIGAAGVGLIAAEHTDSTVGGGGISVGTGGATTPDPTLATGVTVAGAALAVAGVVLLVISHDEHYEASLH